MVRAKPLPMTGLHKEQNIRDAVRMYSDKKSVREIATELHVSYGKAHRLLSEGGVTFRPRGGATRTKTTAAGR